MKEQASDSERITAYYQQRKVQPYTGCERDVLKRTARQQAWAEYFAYLHVCRIGGAI